MLKKSITKRMFIGITSVVIGFAAIILLANTLLLSPLYYKSLENSMSDSMSKMAGIDFSSERSQWLNEVYNISSGSSYDIVIKRNELTVFSSSIDIGLKEYPEDPAYINNYISQREPKPRDPFQPLNQNMEWDEIDEGIFIGYSTDPKSNNEFILCTTQLDNGLSILLTQPVAPIDASIVQSNLLLLICTFIILTFSILFALRFSRGFTKPIKQIQRQVGRISNLDFSSELQIGTGDELESLSSDVNKLAEKLSDSLKELKDKNLQLEKDIIAQRSFIANASHELRTPLSLIKGYADELNSGFLDNSDSQKIYHQIISDECTKLSRILNEMLDLSRLESGRMELSKEAIPIRDFINSFIDKYSGFIKENNLNIELDLCENCSCLHDPMRLEQILANFISNASKYCDNSKQIVISAKSIKDKIRISVFNSGKQIDEASIDRIWDGFYKADSTRTRSKDSYGLGLSIVKAIQTLACQSYGVANLETGVEFWIEAEST